MRTPNTLTGRRFMALLLALLMLCASVPAAVAEETEVFGCVTEDQVKLRQNASKTAGYWELLPKGWVMTIQGTTTVQGNLWYRVKGGVPSAPEGTYTGYILGDCFRPLTLEETAIWLNERAQGTITGDPLEETEEAEPVFANVGGWVTTAVSGVNLRSAPQSTGDILAVLPHGAMLQVTGYANGWFMTEYNGESGYISDAYVRSASAEEMTAYFNGTEPEANEESDALPVLLTRRASAAAAPQAGIPATVYTANGETITLRADKAKNATVLAFLPNGTAVTIIEDSGEWAKILYDSREGYVLKEGLIPSAAPAAAAQGTAVTGTSYLIGTGLMATVNVPSGTLPLLKEASDSADSLKSIPNRSELFILEARSDWSKTIYAGKTGYVDTQMLILSSTYTGNAPYITITSQKRVNVRQDARKNAKVIDRVTSGTVLPLWASPWTNDGYTWYPVTVNKVNAYIRGDCCRLMTAAEYNGQGKDDPAPAPDKQELSNVFESLSSALNIRAAATTASKSLGKLRLHNRMTFTGSATVNGVLWYKVDYKGSNAFVMGKFVRVLTKKEAGDSDKTPTPAPTPVIPAGLSDVAYTVKNNIYIRKENTMKSNSLDKIRKGGSYMTWLGETLPDKNGENYTWYHIEYLNLKGWIRGDLIHVMTVEEWEKAFGTPTPTPAVTPTAPIVTPVPTATPTPRPGTLTDVAYTIKNNILLRKENTMKSTSITKIYLEHSYMTLLGEIKADKNGENFTWYHVNYNKKIGWIRGDLIHVMTNDEWDEEFATPTPAVTATPAPTSVPDGGSTPDGLKPYVAYDILRYGSSGAAVTQLQQKLYEQGYLAPANVTGVYTDPTRQAVSTFQKDNGLTADGVAGQLTLAALYGTVAYDTTIYPVEKVNWSVANKLWARGTVAMVTDVNTGLSFAAKRYAGGSHADVEPLTAADTAIMCRIYNVENAQEISENNLYQRHPLWVTIGGRSLAASMYGVPHNPSGDTLPDNDYTGQFCIHFVGSKVHRTNEVDKDHQNAINYAYNHAPVKK